MYYNYYYCYYNRSVAVANVQLAGWALIGVGLWIHIFQESLLIGVLLKDNPTAPMLVIDRVPVTLIGCGAVITVVGFLGCCGACTESVCFLGFVSISIISSSSSSSSSPSSLLQSPSLLPRVALQSAGTPKMAPSLRGNLE